MLPAYLPNVKDLWGNDIVYAEPVAEEVGQKKKTTRPNGYAAQPGSGPSGETCKTCEHYARMVHVRYRKCLLVRDNWTRGPGTDVLAKSPACAFWKRKE